MPRRTGNWPQLSLINAFGSTVVMNDRPLVGGRPLKEFFHTTFVTFVCVLTFSFSSFWVFKLVPRQFGHESKEERKTCTPMPILANAQIWHWEQQSCTKNVDSTVLHCETLFLMKETWMGTCVVMWTIRQCAHALHRTDACEDKGYLCGWMCLRTVECLCNSWNTVIKIIQILKNFNLKTKNLCSGRRFKRPFLPRQRKKINTNKPGHTQKTNHQLLLLHLLSRSQSCSPNIAAHHLHLYHQHPLPTRTTPVIITDITTIAVPNTLSLFLVQLLWHQAIQTSGRYFHSSRQHTHTHAHKAQLSSTTPD